MRAGLVASTLVIGLALTGCGPLETTSANSSATSTPDPTPSSSVTTAPSSESEWCYDTLEPPPCDEDMGVRILGTLYTSDLETSFSFGFPSPYKTDARDGSSVPDTGPMPDLVARVYGSDGTLESEESLAVSMHSSGDGVGFEISMQGVDGHSRAELVADGAVVGSLEAGSQAPTVSDIRFEPHEFGLDISWSGADPDGDDVEYTVIMVDPDGQRNVVTINHTGTSLTAGSEDWPLRGGEGQRIVVVASDGLNVGWGVSDPVNLADNPPEIYFEFEETSVTTSRLNAIVLGAFAFDQEDQERPETQAALADSITWTSDIDGVLATGPEFYLNGGTMLDGPDISVGLHTITVSVTDSGGNTAEDTFTLAVE